MPDHADVVIVVAYFDLDKKSKQFEETMHEDLEPRDEDAFEEMVK